MEVVSRRGAAGGGSHCAAWEVNAVAVGMKLYHSCWTHVNQPPIFGINHQLDYGQTGVCFFDIYHLETITTVYEEYSTTTY